MALWKVARGHASGPGYISRGLGHESGPGGPVWASQRRPRAASRAPSRFSRSARQIPALSAWNPGSSLFLEENLTLSTNLPFGIPRNEILDSAYRQGVQGSRDSEARSASPCGMLVRRMRPADGCRPYNTNGGDLLRACRRYTKYGNQRSWGYLTPNPPVHSRSQR